MIIYGKNPVIEALSGTPSKVEEIMIAAEAVKERYREVIKLARDNHVRVSFLPQKAISKISDTTNHQGVLARVIDFEYVAVDSIIVNARDKGEKLLLIILDHVEDPQNLGAIIRTINVLGAHGLVIPKDRAAPITPTVVKASAGAASFVPIARVVNIATTIRELKKEDVWVVGADQEALKSVFEEDLGKLDLALVIGSEGRGLSRLVREGCDFLVSIPRAGEVSSLNASVAAGIMMYEIMRQRRMGKR